MNPSKPLYILDTNVWLDWLVFSDEAIKPLQAAHGAGEVDIIYTAQMRVELADVISRAHFKRTEAQQAEMMQRMQGLAREVPEKTPLMAIRCADPDDQVFIDTALAYAAEWLLTKDNHLLDLRKRAAKHQVNVGTLSQWQSEYRLSQVEMADALL